MSKLRKMVESYEWVNEISNKTMIELKKTTDILEELNNKFFQRYNTSNAKFNVLVIVYKGLKDGVMLSDIGESMLVTKANVTGMIDRLEKEGYVRRIRDEIDRRKIMAVITEKGKKFTEEVIENYKKWSKDVMDILDSHEKEVLIKILGKMQTELIKF